METLLRSWYPTMINNRWLINFLGQGGWGRALVQRLTKIHRYQDFSVESLASGVICFYGSLWLALIQGASSILEWSVIEDQVFALTILYLRLDHFIDNPKIDRQRKERLIRSLQNYLQSSAQLPERSFDGTDNESLDLELQIIIQEMVGLLEQLLKITPEARPWLQKCFEAEIIGYHLQSKPLMTDRSLYLRIARDKGGYMVQAIQAIVGLTRQPQTERDRLLEQGFQLGAIIQLLDDLLDYTEDRRDGINTIISYDCYYQPRIFNELANEIYHLDGRYNLFKPMLTWLFVLGCSLIINDFGGHTTETTISHFKQAIDRGLRQECLKIG